MLTQEPKHPRELSEYELRSIVRQIQSTLYHTDTFWDRDKEWDTDTLIGVGEILAAYDLTPHFGTEDEG